MDKNYHDARKSRYWNMDYRMIILLILSIISSSFIITASGYHTSTDEHKSSDHSTGDHDHDPDESSTPDSSQITPTITPTTNSPDVTHPKIVSEPTNIIEDHTVPTTVPPTTTSTASVKVPNSPRSTTEKTNTGLPNTSVKNNRTRTVSSKAKDELCETEKCADEATAVWNNMNRSIKPCTNFYGYVCGGFRKNVARYGRYGVDTYNLVQYKVHLKLLDLLEERSPRNESNVLRSARTFYQNCMKHSVLNSKDVKTLKSILQQLGGFPLVEGAKWNQATFSHWTDIAAKINEMGFIYQSFISISVRPDMEDRSINRINIGESNMYAEYPEFLLSNKRHVNLLTKNLLSIIINILVGNTRSVNSYAPEMNDAFAFWEQLAAVLERTTLVTDENHSPMKIKTLAAKYPSIPWVEFLNKMIKPTKAITENDIVNVIYPKYFVYLEKLLSSTTKKTQMNAMMLGVIYASIPYVNGYNVQMAYQTYKTQIQNQDGKQLADQGWNECLLSYIKLFPLAAGNLYAKTYFDHSAKQNVDQIAADVIFEMSDMLTKATWIDEKTRELAIEKVKSITTYMAFPNQLLDDKEISNYYKNVRFNATSNLMTMLAINHFNMRRSYDLLGKQSNGTDWSKHGSTADVSQLLYYFRDNSIEVPAGVLQRPFYESQRPAYMNYATAGSIVAILATHAWDDMGRHFDKLGNNAEWWGTKTKLEYQKRAACYIQQYNDMKISNEDVNGMATEVSNIADHVGLTVAYRAYQDWVKRNGAEPLLAGLPYNTKQLFWISAASMHCYVYNNPRYMTKTEGIHAPGIARVLGAMSNIPEFAKDFQCAKNSRMNPVKKCRML